MIIISPVGFHTVLFFKRSLAVPFTAAEHRTKLHKKYLYLDVQTYATVRQIKVGEMLKASRNFQGRKKVKEPRPFLYKEKSYNVKILFAEIILSNITPFIPTSY